MSPKEVATRFYEAFQQRNGQVMASYYCESASFSDPVFAQLDSREVKAMWRMLCERTPELKVEFRVESVKGNDVRVQWEARYPFSQTGKQVRNIVHSELRIEEGKIVRHRDQFSFWRWSAQALGAPGILLGWSPILRRQVARKAKQSLNRFLSR